MGVDRVSRGQSSNTLSASMTGGRVWVNFTYDVPPFQGGKPSNKWVNDICMATVTIAPFLGPPKALAYRRLL